MADRALVQPPISKLDRAELLALIDGIGAALLVTDIDVARARWHAAMERSRLKDQEVSAAAAAYAAAAAREQDALAKGLRARSEQNDRIAASGAYARVSGATEDAFKRAERLYRDYLRLWNEREASR